MADDKTPAGQAPPPIAGEDPAAKAAADKAATDTAAAAEKGKTPEQLAAEKTTADEAAAAAAADAARQATATAPEKYELTLPDGDWLDASDLTAFEAQARAKGLTNEEAQAAIEEHADQVAARSQAFRAVTEKDPTYGGANLKESTRLANLALDHIAPKGDPLGDEFRRDIAKTGYNNKLSVLAALVRVGKLMAEDSPPGGGGAGGGHEKTLEEHLYPTMKK